LTNNDYDEVDAAATDDETADDDMRALVAAQLMRLQGLIGRFERRRVAERAPWGDPRRGQGRVLALLKMKPEISQRELTYLLDMSKQSLAELLGKLEKASLISREPSADDKRVTMVRLTEAGKLAGQWDDTAPTQVDQVLGVLSDDELTTLSAYLARLIEQLERSVGGDDIDERRAMMLEFQRRHGAGHKHMRDSLDPRLIGEYDPRFDRPDPRFGPPEPPDPRFGPPVPPDPRFGPGPGPDPRFDPRLRDEYGPRGGRGHHRRDWPDGCDPHAAW